MGRSSAYTVKHIRKGLTLFDLDSRGKSWKQWTEHSDWFDGKFATFMPFNSAWRNAYPKLEATLGDDPFAPWNNALVGNRFCGCGRDFQFDKGVLAVTNRMEISRNEAVKSSLSGPLRNQDD